MKLTTEQTECWKQLMANPNEERSLATSNHISELMFDCFTKHEAIEAVCYWRNKYDELYEKQNQETHDKRMDRLLSEAFGFVTKPAFQVPLAKDVPLFWADPKNRGFLIREIDGKQETVYWSEATHDFVVYEGAQK
jgi:hypothetical protein